MRLDLFCSNVGEGYCIKSLESKMGKTPNFGVFGGPNPPLKWVSTPNIVRVYLAERNLCDVTKFSIFVNGAKITIIKIFQNSQFFMG